MGKERPNPISLAFLQAIADVGSVDRHVHVSYDGGEA